MLINEFTGIDKMLAEKQIQPAQGKTEGNVLVLGGGPGSGKNWVLNNLTDVKNRYKVFDVDSILEVAATLKESKFLKSFESYIRSMDDEIVVKELLDHLNAHGVLGFLKSSDSFINQVLRDFIEFKDFPKNQKYSFLLSVLDGNKPNIALNGTLRSTGSVKSRLELIGEAGYDIDKNVDFMFVVTPTQQAIQNASKRAQAVRNVDLQFLMDARQGFMDNMLKIVEDNSDLSKYVRNIYIVFNSPSDTTYYPNTNLVKNFKYMKLKPNQTDKIRNLKKLLNTTYV